MIPWVAGWGRGAARQGALIMMRLFALDAEAHVEGGIFQKFHGVTVPVRLVGPVRIGQFLADPEALKKYYGQGLREKVLPQAENIESVPKDDVFKKFDTDGTNYLERNEVVGFVNATFTHMGIDRKARDS